MNVYIYTHLVVSGYVVIASPYRGNDRSEGTDEIGGADINDVIALLPVIKELSYVDSTTFAKQADVLQQYL
ncbi:hypothetical protein H0X06_06715 [Candidatus Dependentiae bacterium]|nr:hypothetical protein [Candidatus Dependentiae bacterium]